jgi:hypothetical protein
MYLYRYNSRMPNEIDQLATQRNALLSQLQAIDRLRRGSLSQQTFTKTQAGQLRSLGPYYLLQGFHHGKKFSERIPAQRAAQVQQQVQNFKRFQQLADQCITLTDQITQLAEPPPESKKNSSRRRSKPSASRKPKLS